MKNRKTCTLYSHLPSETSRKCTATLSPATVPLAADHTPFRAPALTLSPTDVRIIPAISPCPRAAPCACSPLSIRNCYSRKLLLASRKSRTNPQKTGAKFKARSEEHTSELQSLTNLVCRLLLEKKKTRVATS